jgi:hypothetical protein
MANKPATEFLVELPTQSKKIQVTFQMDEADHKQVLDYLSYLTKASGQEVTLDLVGTTAFRYLLRHDRLYRQLSGKAKPKKKAAQSKPQPTSPPPSPSPSSLLPRPTVERRPLPSAPPTQPPSQSASPLPPQPTAERKPVSSAPPTMQPRPQTTTTPQPSPTDKREPRW